MSKKQTPSEYIKNLLNQRVQIDEIDKALLQELIDYDPKKDKIAKAWRVYGLCKKSGRIILANKIAVKYQLFKADDVVDAFAIAMMCQLS